MRKFVLLLFLMLSSGLTAQSFSFECSSPEPPAIYGDLGFGVLAPLNDGDPLGFYANALVYPGVSLVVSPTYDNVRYYYFSNALGISNAAVPEDNRIVLPVDLVDWTDYTFFARRGSYTSSGTTIYIEIL